LIELAIAMLLLLLSIGYVAYKQQQIWKVVTWILEHVQVVSKANQNDPGLKEIKRIFGIKEEKGDGN